MRFLWFRTVFLDYDGWGHVHAIEQNFNPSADHIKHRTSLGKITVTL